MEVHFIAHGGVGAADGGLLDWLQREPELRGHVAARREPAQPGTMGVPVVIAVSLLGNSAILALARSVRTWLEHRKPVVEVELDTPRGRFHYKVADDAGHDNAELVRRVTELMQGPEQEADSSTPHNR